MKRQIEYRKYISRQDLQRERHKIFLFGDNLLKEGCGGQAGAMRGEPNALGIPTKKAPYNFDLAFFNDAEFDANCREIDRAFDKIPPGVTVVIPIDGLGTGRAKLREKAPRTYEYLRKKLEEL